MCLSISPEKGCSSRGDVLSSCELNLADGYPYEWIETLNRAEQLDFEWVIGGHGDVLRGKERFELYKSYLRDLMGETAQAYALGATLAQAEQRVAPKLLAQYAERFPGGLPLNGLRPPCPWALSQDVVANIEKAYRVVSGMN